MRRTINEKTNQIEIIESKIEQLSEELTSRGIYSYPQATLLEDSNSSSMFLITLNGTKPIQNLEIEFKPVYGYKIDKGSELYELHPGFTSKIQSLNAHNPIAFEIEDFKKEIEIDLIFKSESNQWNQHIKAKKTSGGEIKIFWIITNRDSQVIDKHIDEGFPTDSDGKLTLKPNKKVKFSEIQMNSVFFQ